MEHRASTPSRLPVLAAVVAIAAITTMAILWPHAALAQEQADLEDEVPPPRMVRMYGIVREPDGAPAAGRLIRFEPGTVDSPEATTGPDGTYSMQVDLRRPLWVELLVDGVVRSRFFRIAAPKGATQIEVNIQLVPPIIMTGAITLPDGRPAANMTLTATGAVMSESCGVAGGGGGSLALDLNTDSSGRYTLPLREGDQTRYDLYISQEGVGCIGPLSIETRIDRPNVRRDFQLTQGGTVEGIVLAAPDGAPLAGATVSVATGYSFHHHAFTRRATTDGHGRFRFTALPPGRYEVEARLRGDPDEDGGSGVEEGLWAVFEPARNQREIEVREGRTHEVEVQMVKELVVTGRVFGPDGAPLRHTMLERMDVETDGEGRFVYRVRPRYGPYGIVFLERDITLTPSVPGVGIAVPVNISFSDAAPREADIHILEPGALTGRALFEGTGRPVAAGCIRLSPDLPPGHTRFLDDDGRFEITDMPPGEYEIGIREQRILGCPTAPVRVTVRPGETLGPLEFRFTPRASFQGRVSGVPETKEITLPEGGRGEFGLEVALAPAGTPKEVQVTFLDLQPDGSFTAWLLSPPTGRYDLVLKGGYPSPTLRVVSNIVRDVDLAAPSLDLQFDLHPGGSISGRVLAADGVTPLPYVAVRARPVEGDALLLVTPPTSAYQEPAVPEAPTDDEGFFVIRGLLPGRYEVSVHWQRDCFGYLASISVALAERERRTGLQFRAPRDWP